MGINPLEIKDKTNYGFDNICYIDDFDVNSLKITKKESRIGANIYCTRCALNLDNDTIIPLHFLINRLIGFIEEIDGSNDKYLVAVSSLRNKKIIDALDEVWLSIKDKINPSIKIKDYDKFRFNFDIDLPVNMIIEFRSLLINVSCVDSTLWADPKRIISLLDFDPKKLNIYIELNSISNTPDASSEDLIGVYEVRYDYGGFYLVIDDIKGYFNIDDNVGSILNLILTDDQKINIIKYGKKFLKRLMMKMEN